MANYFPVMLKSGIYVYLHTKFFVYALAQHLDTSVIVIWKVYIVKPTLVTTSIKLVKHALVTTSIKLQSNLL